jgi:hypothetical protein
MSHEVCNVYTRPLRERVAGALRFSFLFPDQPVPS